MSHYDWSDYEETEANKKSKVSTAIDHNKMKLIQKIEQLEGELSGCKEMLINGKAAKLKNKDLKTIVEEQVVRLYRNLQYTELACLDYLRESYNEEE